MRGVVEFDWNAGNREKCQKHGISIAEIEAVFQRKPRTGIDAAHSLVEERFIAIDFKGAGRPIFIVFTMRDMNGRQVIRPISARYMHQKELDCHA